MPTKIDPEDIRRLRNLIPLTSLSGSKFDELCTRIRIESGDKGTVLFRQGDKKNEFVYLLTGTISLRAGEVEMDVIEGETETSRFALAHQLPRKINAVAADQIRYVRIDSRLLYSSDSAKESSSGYRVTDLPEESSSDWMTTLLKSPIFQRLPASNLQKIIINLEEIELEKGEQVVRQGEPGDFYYIIKKGRCILTRKPNPNSKEIKLAQLKSCDTFGEDALISGQPRNVSISMITPGVMLRLKKDKFLELIKDPILDYVEFSSLKNELTKGDALVDIRSPDAFEKNHLQNSRNVPFFSLRMQMHTFDRNQRTILVCEDGRSSEAAAFLLIRNELDAVVLRGGIQGIPEDRLVQSDKNSLFGLKNLFADTSAVASSKTEIPESANNKNQPDENRNIFMEPAREIASVASKPADLEKPAVNSLAEKPPINDWLAKKEGKSTHAEGTTLQNTMVLEKETPVAEEVEIECAANTSADSNFRQKVSESQPSKAESLIQPLYEELTKTAKVNGISTDKKESKTPEPEKTEPGSTIPRNDRMSQPSADTGKLATAVKEDQQDFRQQIETLTQQNEELKSVLQGFVNEKHDQNTNQAINSLTTELEMIRDQADSDVQAMKEQLETAQCETANLRKELEQKQRRILELKSSPTHNLTPQLDSESLDIQSPLADTEHGANSDNERRKNGRQLVLVGLSSAVIGVILAVSLIMGTESGQRLATSSLNINAAKIQTPPKNQPKTVESDFNVPVSIETQTEYGQNESTSDNNVTTADEGGNLTDQPETTESGLDTSVLTEPATASDRIVTKSAPDGKRAKKEKLTGQPASTEIGLSPAQPAVVESLPKQPGSRSQNEILPVEKAIRATGHSQQSNTTKPSVSDEPLATSKQPLLPADRKTDAGIALPKVDQIPQTVQDVKESKEIIERLQKQNSPKTIDEF